MAPVHPQSESVVEVVDTFGDTVAAVTHLQPTLGRDRRPWFLGAACASLVIAFMCFFHAVGVASSNKSAFHRHVAEGRVAHEFRPVRVSLAVEWGGAVALALGMGFAFAYVASRRRNKDRLVAECDLGGGTEAGFELVRVEAQGAFVSMPSSFEATLSTREGELSGEALNTHTRWGEGGMREVALPSDGTLRLASGARSFHLRWVPPANSRALAARFGMDSQMASYVGGTAAAALLFLVMLNNVRPDTKRLFNDSYGASERMVAVNTKAYEDALEKEREKLDAAGTASDQDAPKEASEAGAKGTTGIKEATAAKAQMQIKDRGAPPSLANRKQAKSYAQQAGVLGLISDRQIFAAIGSPSDFASGDGAADWYGGMEGGPVGHQVGELSGTWGSDVTGFGVYGTVKVGNKIPGYLTGGGTCDDGRPCGTGGSVKLRGHDKRVPDPVIGYPKSSPGLDKDIIRRYIKRKRTRIRHCYEKRLLVKPELAGNLTVFFSISGQGSVIGAKAKGMSDEPFQSCVADVVGGIKFPATDSNSVVNVRYPFTFQSAGG